MKKYLPYLPYAVILILLLLVGFMFQRINKLSETVKNKDSIIAEKNDSLEYRRNESGRLVAEKLAAEASYKEIREAYPRLAAELKADFDVKMKDLKAYVRNEIQASGSGNAEVHNHYTTDSTGKRYPYWELKASDGYLNFSADVIDSLHAPYKYSYQDTIVTVVHTKKKNWFAKEKLFTSSSLSNPNAKSVNSTSLLVSDYKDKRWVVWAGVGYDIINTQPMLGVGIGYALIKF